MATNLGWPNFKSALFNYTALQTREKVFPFKNCEHSVKSEVKINLSPERENFSL